MKCSVFIVLALFAIAAEAHRDWSKIKGKYVSAKTKIPAIKPRIVGGQAAEPHGLPYQAALIIDDSVLCGGAIIDDDAVLTSASCVDSASKVEVVVGAHNITNEAEESRQVIPSKQLIIHEEWDKSVLRNDLAIVLLAEKIKLGTTAKVIKLNKKTYILDGLEATVSGWGAKSDSETGYSDILHYTSEEIMANKLCDAFFGFVSNLNLCLNSRNSNGPCKGDFGGPLTIVTEKGVLLAGIASYGSEYGCQIGFPSVYTRISKFDKWIKKNIPKQ